jgi:hypothetical protein
MADNFTFRDGAGTSQTMGAKDTGSGIYAPYNRITDGSAHFMPAGDAATRGIYVVNCDGTNTISVKPSSTAPLLTDTALVVCFSPNCPLSKPTAGAPIRVCAKTSIKGSAGVLFGLTMINVSGSTRWVQFFDAATVGAVTLGTTLPDLEFQILANSQILPYIPDYGIPFGNGIIMAVTTTEGGLTVGTAGDVLTFPQWV